MPRRPIFYSKTENPSGAILGERTLGEQTEQTQRRAWPTVVCVLKSLVWSNSHQQLLLSPRPSHSFHAFIRQARPHTARKCGHGPPPPKSAPALARRRRRRLLPSPSRGTTSGRRRPKGTRRSGGRSWQSGGRCGGGKGCNHSHWGPAPAGVVVSTAAASGCCRRRRRGGVGMWVGWVRRQ